jgi:hypothetical protein
MIPTIPKGHSLAIVGHRLWLTFLILLLIIDEVSAQTEEISVLPQYFAADPLIRRDPLFEKLHTSLNSAMRETGLGLNENITAKLDELERYVSDFKIRASVNPGNTVKVEYEFFGVTNSRTFTQASIEAEANAIADEFILKALENMPEGPAVGDEMDLNRLLLFILSSAVQRQPVDLAKFTTFSSDDFRRQFKHDFRQYMKSVMGFNFAGGQEFEYNVKILQTKLTALTDNIKGNIIAKKYELDNAIEQVSKQANSSLLSANAGLGINEVEGNLGGGLMLTFKTENQNKTPKLSFGVFINGVGELGTKDTSAIKQPFLAGIAVQYRLNNAFQITGIGSAKYNEAELSDSHWVAELGGGLLYRTSEGFILGGSAYYLFTGDRSIDVINQDNSVTTTALDHVWTVGLTVRGNASSSPTVLLGFSNQSKQTTPVFQISYPINFGQQ